jgi:HEAT repeat protein
MTFVGSGAAMGLAQLGKCAVPALLEVLVHGTDAVRCLTASVLGSTADQRAIEPVSGFLASQDEDVRIAGIEALAEIGGERCLAAIRQCLDDPAPRVREIVAYWLQESKTASTPR